MLSLEIAPNTPEAVFVFEQLREYNRTQATDDAHQILNLFVRNDNDEIVAGLLGDTYWGWLSISILWVREDVRRVGYGTQLIQAAEAEAKRRGCHHAHVDTMDFQAPEFYKKHGYEIWGILDDLPIGHQRIFFKKRLK